MKLSEILGYLLYESDVELILLASEIDNLDDEKRELKLIPMSELTNRDHSDLDMLSTFKNKNKRMNV